MSSDLFVADSRKLAFLVWAAFTLGAVYGSVASILLQRFYP